MKLGRHIHAHMIFVGEFAADLYVGNIMIDIHVNVVFWDCGRMVFDEMPNRVVVSWI